MTPESGPNPDPDPKHWLPEEIGPGGFPDAKGHRTLPGLAWPLQPDGGAGRPLLGPSHLLLHHLIHQGAASLQAMRGGEPPLRTFSYRTNILCQQCLMLLQVRNRTKS